MSHSVDNGIREGAATFLYPRITPGAPGRSDAAMRGWMTRRPGWQPPTALLLAGLLAGCGPLAPTTAPGPTSSAASATSGGSPAPSASTGAPSASAGAVETEPPTCAQATLDGMSLPERVGQLFMVKLPTMAVGSTIRDAIG